MLQYSLLEFGAIKMDHPKIILILYSFKNFPIEGSELRKLLPHEAIINFNRLIGHFVALVTIIIAHTMIIVASSAIRLLIFILTLFLASSVIFTRSVRASSTPSCQFHASFIAPAPVVNFSHTDLLLQLKTTPLQI